MQFHVTFRVVMAAVARMGSSVLSRPTSLAQAETLPQLHMFLLHSLCWSAHTLANPAVNCTAKKFSFPWSNLVISPVAAQLLDSLWGGGVWCKKRGEPLLLAVL